MKEKLKELYNKIDSIHTELSKANMDMEDYNPMSEKLIEVKRFILVDLVEEIKSI